MYLHIFKMFSAQGGPVAMFLSARLQTRQVIAKSGFFYQFYQNKTQIASTKPNHNGARTFGFNFSVSSFLSQILI
jgi:hypothetical protein